MVETCVYVRTRSSLCEQELDFLSNVEPRFHVLHRDWMCTLRSILFRTLHALCNGILHDKR